MDYVNEPYERGARIMKVLTTVHLLLVLVIFIITFPAVVSQLESFINLMIVYAVTIGAVVSKNKVLCKIWMIELICEIISGIIVLDIYYQYQVGDSSDMTWNLLILFIAVVLKLINDIGIVISIKKSKSVQYYFDYKVL